VEEDGLAGGSGKSFGRVKGLMICCPGLGLVKLYNNGVIGREDNL
jgi:hypothetical protein